MSRIFTRAKTVSARVWQSFKSIVLFFPFVSFLVLLGILVGAIATGNYLNQPEPVVESVPEPKVVTTYSIGANPELKVQAKIEKDGVVKLIAQSSGVVQKIKVSEGGSVKRGTPVLTLSTNYQGANAPAVTRQISQKNLKFLNETYQTQIDALNNSRTIAQKTETQASELRAIARQSVDDTKSLISLNEEIIRSFDQQIKNLEAINVNGASDSAILSIKSSKAQVLGALAGLRTGLRNTEYLNNEDQEPAEIARLLRDNTLKQLDIQEKSLQLNKDIAGLNLKLAKINESLMYPASPCPGVVERVHVKEGQLVNPGTLLATIKTNDQAATAVVLVSPQVARHVSPFTPSYLLIEDMKIGVEPRYISQEPTDGTLHSVLYSIPEAYTGDLSNSSYVEMIVPIGPSRASDGVTPYVPLDAIYQNQDAAYVYIVGTNDKGQSIVVSRKIQLGRVFGNYVAVPEGLSDGDLIILDRTVLPGEVIKPLQELG